MDEVYQPARIEIEVQERWDRTRAFRVTEDPAREKFYCLAMFPYPSGRLHMGHVRNYTIADLIARYQRMLGKNVLQPMGWDASGLPAENAAIDNGVPPARWTYANIEYMRRQLKRLGFAYDWDREIATCKPEYYRWEQWFFTKLYERGLVYKKTALVNWDPVDQTVLANEQVIDGRGWRSGAVVERREIPQWFLRITAYADELLDELDRLSGWPEAVRTMQRNWIGRSAGVEARFRLAEAGEDLVIFTTRPDTIMGVTYMAVAAEHPLALRSAERDGALRAFLDECRQTAISEASLETMEKRGMPLGVNAIHPVSGDLIPVWVANFVLTGYGTGAVMAVPAHDERDWEFARKYGLPIKPVVFPADGSALDMADGANVAPGALKDSGPFTGSSSEDAFGAVADYLASRGLGGRKVHYRLRDWGVSRQRYWGCPIPMLNLPDGQTVPVPEEDLPVVLPEDVEFEGVRSPLKAMRDFSVARLAGAEGAERETDTFDTFMESSWYYARFCCPDNDQAMLDARARYWLPVDQYVGGIEHAVLHLLYARFFHKLLRDAGLVGCDEPFTRLLTQGMVVAETFFRDAADGRRTYYSPADVSLDHDERGRVVAARLLSDGRAVGLGGIEKMSKSRNNGVDPQTLIEKYGADTVRLYMMFTSPPDQSLEWSDAAVEGASRFLRKLWRLVASHVAARPARATGITGELSPVLKELRRRIHQTISVISDDLGRRYAFNHAIAVIMELTNALADLGEASSAAQDVRQEGLETIVLLLAPIVPHITDVMWRALGHEQPIIDAPWPRADATALVREELTLVVQVNGKKRASLNVAADATAADIEAAALANNNVRRFVDGQSIQKVVVVPGRLINIVCAPGVPP